MPKTTIIKDKNLSVDVPHACRVLGFIMMAIFGNCTDIMPNFLQKSNNNTKILEFWRRLV